jgi:tetratricopeptide (TPR) repeat protein
LERWLDTHRQAAGFLMRYPADPRADRMAKCALQAGINALKADPPMEVAEFVKFVESTVANLATTNPSGTGSAPATSPAQTVGPEVAWYGGSVLLDRGRYPEAERLFRAVPAHSPFYLRAQYGLALAGWKQVERKTTTALRPGQTQDPLAPTLAALTRFVQAARRGIEEDDRPAADRVVDLGTRVVMHLIGRERPDLKLAAGLLDDVESLPQAKDRDARLRLALRIEIAILAASPDPDSVIMQFVVQKRPATAELAGVLNEVNKSVARRCRELASHGQNDEATQLADALVNVYRRLLPRIAASQSAEARQHEAAIRGQLARSLQELARPAEAVTQYEWLEKNAPAGLSAEDLKSFAAAYEQIGAHDPAIGIWSRLAKSLPPHTESWYEARYRLIECYRQAGLADHARNLLDYFLLQNPEIKVESWRQKFDDLKRVLPKRPERSGGKG